mmetsp:Transcript_25826/g.43011  ORF Transcript_25826/g.43011 Transcript_25826/m.43011 type:complete len:92 (+) Transcript_25826:206-481(+)
MMMRYCEREGTDTSGVLRTEVADPPTPGHTGLARRRGGTHHRRRQQQASSKAKEKQKKKKKILLTLACSSSARKLHHCHPRVYFRTILPPS